MSIMGSQSANHLTYLKNLEIINAHLPGYSQLQNLLIDEEGIIIDIFPSEKFINSAPQTKSINKLNNSKIINLQSDWLSLGGLDLQINGCLGLAFPDLTPEDLPKLTKICRYLWQLGIDSFLPTIVTTSREKIQRSLKTIADFMTQQSLENHAEILGVHLEGPCLNREKRGAHPEQYLQPLNKKQIINILGDYSHIIKIVTLAPELEPSNETIYYLKSLGITISLGHSQATAKEAKKAFHAGASMVTHAFNAMPSLHHRYPGLLGEAIINNKVYCGLIADGQHVCPTMIKILLQASNYEEGIFLVSDALAPIGLADGIYPWDERQIEVIDGTARLKNGTLAGTTLPLLVGVQNLVKWGLCSPIQAIAMATESPRKAIGLSGISKGQKATLLRWKLDEQNNQLLWQRLASA